MEHRGEILKKALVETGMSQRELGRRMKLHHNTVGSYIERSDITDEVMLEIGTHLRIDFTERIPSLRKAQKSASESFAAIVLAANDRPVSGDVPMTLPACQLALLTLQSKYIHLLETHQQTLTQLRQVA
jgi:transcriptional regulator with XRE-family HTH domain